MASTPQTRSQLADQKRQRVIITAEGLSLPLTVASRGARAGALLLDLTLISVSLFVLMIIIIAMGVGIFDVGYESSKMPALEALGIGIILLLFFARFGYFLMFELGPRGATPGKRLLGIRVAARPGTFSGGKLTAEAVIARNLMRDVEVFIPTFFLLSGQAEAGLFGAAAFVWLAGFVLFPCFNRDNLRAGDLVAGTWVVEVPRHKLPDAMSVTEDRSSQYRFGETELTIYGEHELQVLERVLRDNRPEAMQEVMETICGKIGWVPGHSDAREFLETFYAALRAHLERGMRFGQRKKDKFE